MKKISLLIIPGLFLFITSVQSQTKRFVKTVATGTGDGSSWTNASSNLQAMIDASAPNDQVWIAKGTYKPTKNVAFTSAHVPLSDPRFKSFDLSDGVKLYGGFNGNESTTGQRNVMNKTILSGDFLGNDVGLTNNSENAYHVVFGANKNNGATLDGLTITGGNTTGQPQAYTNNNPWYSEITADGAGIYTYTYGTLMQNCVFINNNASHNGGAIYAYDVGGNYYNCLFLNNHALDGSASYTQALGFSLYSHFVNCTMFNNSSGGAVCKNTVADNTYMYNCIIRGNTVTGLSAGGYYVYYSDVQNAFAPGNNSFDGTVDADPVFSNAADVDGADNILGTADDGLIPQCGPAIGGGTNGPVTFTKDFKNGTRILNGTIDMGAYETSLSQAINSLTILSLSNHSTTENLPAGLCEGMLANFAAQISGNGGVFQWTQNGINVGTNSPSLSISNFHFGDQLRLTLTNPPNTCGSAAVVQSNIITLANVSSGAPVIPSNITGPTNACPYFDGTPVPYKINKAPGGIKYHWYVGFGAPGVNIVSHPNGGGVNDTIVMVTFDASWDPASGVRYLYVSTENWCGVSSAKKIQIKQTLPQTPGSITGPTDACPYMQSASHPSGIPVSFAIHKVLDASSYIWVVPSGVTINSHSGTGANDTAIVVTFSSSFVSGSISVQAINFCGAKSPKVISISKKVPGTPGTITGPAESCQYIQSAANPSGTPVDYTIRKVTYATSYSWTLPAGVSVTHPWGAGLNDTLIRVTYLNSFTGGPITVAANSNCSISSVRSLTITKTTPAMPYYIIGLTDVCPVIQSPNNPSGTPTDYTVKKVAAAASYTWTLPAGTTVTHPGGSGVNDTIIRVTYLSSFTGGMIGVVSNGNCGSSAMRTLDVLRRLPSAPGAITASAPTACPQRRITYSLSSMPSFATSVLWIVPASGTIISGQGTLSLVVEFAGPTLSTDSIKAIGVNACASSSQRKLKVGVLPACRPAGKDNVENIPSAITKAKNSLQNDTNEFNVTAMPNPSQQHFTLHLAGNNIPISMRVIDATGRSIESKSNIQTSQTIIIGDSWKPGIYFATFMQGSKKKNIRLVKL